MAQYLSQTRIEGPVWLEPSDISFLRARISETETQLEDLERQMDELERSYVAQFSNLVRIFSRSEMARYLSQTLIEGPFWLEPSDISFLLAPISEAEPQVEDLERQMDELKRSYEAQLSNLVRRRDAKLVDIASYRNIYSPVRRVPQEILSEIFELCCLPYDVQYLNWDTSLRTIALSSVCAAWRKAACATPRLWSNQYLTPRTHIKAFEETAWVQKWIDRCRGYPLDLSLDLDDDGLDAATRLLEFVLRFRQNIRSLYIVGPSLSYLPLFQLQLPSLPVLETVSLWLLDDIDEEGIREQLVALFPHKINVFLNAPKLRIVEIREANNNTVLDLLSMPVSLTSLSIVSSCVDTPATEQYLADMLFRFENLVHLTIEHWSDSGPVEMSGISSHISVFLPALKSLHVSYHMVSGSGVTLLRCLCTPCLEELDLSYDGWDDVEDFGYLAADLAIFQQRSSTALSSLMLRHFIALEDNSLNLVQTLVAILSLFPTVQSLLMFGLHLYDINLLFHALAYDKSHSVLLPKLMDLELSFNCHKYCSSDLTAMIFSRCWPNHSGSVSDGPCRLRKVTIDDWDMTRIPKVPRTVVYRDLQYDS